jgi:hypothetical protein
MNMLRTIGVGAILILMIYVVLVPNVTYAPLPRLMLFLLAASAIAIFLGAEAGTRFKLELPGFLFVAVGTTAVAVFLLWFLNNALKPELQVAIYQVQDEDGRDLRVDFADAVQLSEVPSGRPGFFVAQRNYLVVTFPELVPEQIIRIRRTTDGEFYTGKLSYAGTRQTFLRLGSDLRKRAK